MIVGILLTCRKHLHDRIISLKGEVWALKIALPRDLLLKFLCQTWKLSSHVYMC